MQHRKLYGCAISRNPCVYQTKLSLKKALFKEKLVFIYPHLAHMAAYNASSLYAGLAHL